MMRVKLRRIEPREFYKRNLNLEIVWNLLASVEKDGLMGCWKG